MKSAGRVIMPITASITGRSRTKDAFCPKSIEFSGTGNGLIAIAVPETRTRLKMLAPIMLPRESAPWPLISEVIAVTNSGS